MTRRPIIALVALTVLWPATAWAHPGHGVGGFSAGLLHPLTGIDHLAALLLVGLCGGLISRDRPWLPALNFLVGMAAGFATGAASHAGLAEALILVSLVALGAVAAVRARAPLGLSTVAVAVFGYAHGMAHGIDAPTSALPALFVGGMLVTGAIVPGAGMWLARLLPVYALRLVGASGAGLGLVLAVTS